MGFVYPFVRIPIKGGMTIANTRSLNPGTGTTKGKNVQHLRNAQRTLSVEKFSNSNFKANKWTPQGKHTSQLLCIHPKKTENNMKLEKILPFSM